MITVLCMLHILNAYLCLFMRICAHTHMHMYSINVKLVYNNFVTQRPTPHPSLITDCSLRTAVEESWYNGRGMSESRRVSERDRGKFRE